MAQGKDYYQILGLDKKASEEDVKKAYRKLAREHHPDMVKAEDKQQAEKRFKEINEAYQVLSDPQKRKMYDQFGHAENGFEGFPGGNQGGRQGPFSYSYTTSGSNPFSGGENFDPYDIFEEIFGFRGFSNARKPRKGKNLYYQIRLDFQEVLFGVEKSINVESGSVKIKIPQGARDGMEIRFPEKGMPGPEGVPAGDLFITVRVRYPDDFQVVGSDIFVLTEIGFDEAALGTVISVPSIDLSSSSGLSKTKLKIPSGTQYGAKFSLRGKGMPKIGSGDQGNVIVQVMVSIPKRLSKKQRKILEEFQNS